MEDQLRVEVCSSIIVASLQMLDDCGSLGLVQEVRQLGKHFLREVSNLLVRPSPRFGQRKDRGELPRGEATGWGTASLLAPGVGMSVGMAIAVPISIWMTVCVGTGLRDIEVQVQSNAKQRGTLLQAVGRG